MVLLIYLTVLIFKAEAHIKFTECQAKHFRTEPGNENVEFETDGQPCQTEARGLTVYNSRWMNVLQNGYL